jgi:transcriptional regulator with XRE-family HTH domain
MESQDDLDRAAGSALKALRQQSGLSQEDLATDANIDQSRLSKVERLGPSVIGWRRFCRIASALGMVVEVRFRPKV